MMTKIGQLRALCTLGLVAALAVGCGDDKQNTDTAATDPGTGTGTDAGTGTGTEGTGATDTPTEATGDETGGDQECDPINQDCPEGSKCTTYGKKAGDAWNANKCVPETGKGQYGDPCSVEGPDMFTGIDNCGKGLICLSVDDNNMNGACVEYCTPELTCPNTSNGNGICFADANEGTLPLCLTLCDPLLQDCPGQGACYGDNTGMPPFFCFTPDPKDGGMDGGACDFLNACLPGLTCADQATQEGCVTDQFGCCAPFCALDEMTCTGAEECTPFFPMMYPGFENVGVCALPG